MANIENGKNPPLADRLKGAITSLINRADDLSAMNPDERSEATQLILSEHGLDTSQIPDAIQSVSGQTSDNPTGSGNNGKSNQS